MVAGLVIAAPAAVGSVFQGCQEMGKYWRIRHGEYNMHQIREIKMIITAMMSETPTSLRPSDETNHGAGSLDCRPVPCYSMDCW